MYRLEKWEVCEQKKEVNSVDKWSLYEIVQEAGMHEVHVKV
jgi:hypothetical protein